MEIRGLKTSQNKMLKKPALSLDPSALDHKTHLDTKMVSFVQIKLLIFQRKQVPDQFDVLRRAASDVDRRTPASQCDVENVDVGGGDVKSRRQEFRRRREESRRSNLDRRFVKAASAAVESFDRLSKILVDQIVDESLGRTEEVALAFGATPVCKFFF